MKAIYNGELLDFKELRLSPTDRGFRYGDGIFETIAIVNNNPRLAEYHYSRITKAAEVFRFDLGVFSFEQFARNCSEIINENDFKPHGKVRCSIWRDGEGLYAPFGKKINYLLTIHPVSRQKNIDLTNVDFSINVTNYPTKTSPFKTISALKYVIAGLEKKEKGLEEIILIDYNGFVSETLDSNIFIKKDGIYITPPIATGCIEGVMRNWLMKELRANQIRVEERLFIPNELLKADSVFTCNAMGIKNILKIDIATFDKEQRIPKILNSIC